MTFRVTLPQRRHSETFSFEHFGQTFTATVGYHPDRTIGEIFLNSSKMGSGADAAARDAAIAVSIAIQHGVPLDVLRKAMTRNEDGSASSPIGKLLDLMEGGDA